MRAGSYCPTFRSKAKTPHRKNSKTPFRSIIVVFVVEIAAMAITSQISLHVCFLDFLFAPHRVVSYLIIVESEDPKQRDRETQSLCMMSSTEIVRRDEVFPRPKSIFIL